jgi:hypothetical protein
VNFYERNHCRHHDCTHYFFIVGVRQLITEAQTIIDRAFAASVAQNLDDRSRLSYEVGYLHGHIRELCYYIKFMEGEIDETLKAFDRLQSK